jgi:hypothetical protein
LTGLTRTSFFLVMIESLPTSLVAKVLNFLSPTQPERVWRSFIWRSHFFLFDRKRTISAGRTDIPNQMPSAA